MYLNVFVVYSLYLLSTLLAVKNNNSILSYMFFEPAGWFIWCFLWDFFSLNLDSKYFTCLVMAWNNDHLWLLFSFLSSLSLSNKDVYNVDVFSFWLICDLSNVDVCVCVRVIYLRRCCREMTGGLYAKVHVGSKTDDVIYYKFYISVIWIPVMLFTWHMFIHVNQYIVFYQFKENN